MKALLVFLTAVIFSASPSLADQTLTINDVGVSIAVPDDWSHDASEKFGYVIRPSSPQKEKIRIHMTAHRGISPEKAVKLGAAKISEIRIRKGIPQEYVLSQKPIKTKSGLVGEAAEIGSGKSSYLTRNYLQQPDGRIFCVCVYHEGDKKFAKEARRMILDSLRITP